VAELAGAQDLQAALCVFAHRLERGAEWMDLAPDQRVSRNAIRAVAIGAVIVGSDNR